MTQVKTKHFDKKNSLLYTGKFKTWQLQFNYFKLKLYLEKCEKEKTGRKTPKSKQNLKAKQNKVMRKY